jgi:hypothetical protein
MRRSADVRIILAILGVALSATACAERAGTASAVWASARENAAGFVAAAGVLAEKALAAIRPLLKPSAPVPAAEGGAAVPADAASIAAADRAAAEAAGLGGAAAAAEAAGETAPAPTTIALPRQTMRTIVADAVPDRGAAAAADLQIPGRAEADRLPADFAIGSLGGVDRAGPAYVFAVAFCRDLAAGRPVGDRFVQRGAQRETDLRAQLAAVKPVAVRLNDQRDTAGASSFVVRWIGEAGSVSGELFLVSRGDGWSVDDLVLDAGAPDFAADGSARFDPLTYKRFL